MVIAAALFAVLTILWGYVLWSRRKYYAFALKMPGPLGLPIIGIVHKIYKMTDILYELPRYASQYNVKTFYSWLGPYPLIYTMEPKFAEIILNSPDTINKSIIYDVISDVTGHGLLTSKTPKWNNHRKLISPCFNHKVLLDFFPIFNKAADALSEKCDKHVDCGEVNVKALVTNVSLRTACAATMGLDFNGECDEKFLNYFEKIVEMTTHRALKPWLSNKTLFPHTSMYKPFMEARTYITNYIYGIVTKNLNKFKQEGLQNNNNKSNSEEESVNIGKTKHIFIDRAIQIHLKKQFTFDDIIQESNTMLIAAFETTATTVYSTLACLAMHPQYQELVFQEILTVFPQREFDVTYEDLKDLVYLDMCINETMRSIASIPMIIRECTKDLPISKGVVIPKGTQIILDLFNIHRDEDIWGSDAKTFNPDHFLPANLVDKHKYSFMPYSKGPRNCLGWQYAGMVLKVVLAKIIRKYQFSTKSQFEDLKFAYYGTVKYVDLPQLEIQRRP